MAAKKGSGRTSDRKKASSAQARAKKERMERDKRAKRTAAAVCLIALGVFLAVGILSDATGVVGTAMQKGIFGVLGVGGYLLPFIVMAFGIMLVLPMGEDVTAKSTLMGLLLLVTLLSLLHLIINPCYPSRVKAIDYYKEAYSLGVSQRTGGGLLGSLLTYVMLLLIGEAGAYVFFIAAILVTLILLTKFSVKDVSEKHRRDDRMESYEAKNATKRRRESDLIIDDALKARTKAHEAENKNDMPADITVSGGGKRKKDDGGLSLLPEKGVIAKGAHSENRSAGKNSIDALLDEAVAAAKEQEKAPDAEKLLEPNEKEQKTAKLRTAKECDPVLTDKNAEKAVERVENATVYGTEYASAMHAESEAPAYEAPETAEADDELMMQSIPQEAIDYQFPPLSLLKQSEETYNTAESPAEKGKLLIETLKSFNVEAKIVNVSVGPVITRFEIQPDRGVRVSRITSLSDDIALALAAPRVRIEAPIPGKSAIGLEIPNSNTSMVRLRDIVESDEFRSAKSAITFAIGKDIAGYPLVADLDKMPHLLIAGQTGSGKSVCINDIIISMAYHAKPKDVQMILIDPKVVEMKMFASLPHLMVPVVTEPKKAAGALKWAVREMETRYAKMAQANAREISRYNVLQEDEGEKLPKLVIIIDELADLMMVAAKDVEDSICRIAQLGRASGIHLIVATQSPRADIITGLIKANIPSRIALAVSSGLESRIIMDSTGAEKLLGKGDMLFHANGANKPIRAQAAFVSDEEVEAVTNFFNELNMGASFAETSLDELVAQQQENAPTHGNGKQEDELLGEAVRVCIETGVASISLIQRRLRVGYARAARLIDIMDQKKIISGYEGSKPRKILITQEEYEQMFGAGGESSDD